MTGLLFFMSGPRSLPGLSWASGGVFWSLPVATAWDHFFCYVFDFSNWTLGRKNTLHWQGGVLRIKTILPLWLISVILVWFCCFLQPLFPPSLDSAPFGHDAFLFLFFSDLEKENYRRIRAGLRAPSVSLQGPSTLEQAIFLGGWGCVSAPFIVFHSFLYSACNPLPICQAPLNTKERRGGRDCWGKTSL